MPEQSRPSAPHRRPSGVATVSPLASDALRGVERIISAAIAPHRDELEATVGKACMQAYDLGKASQARLCAAFVATYLEDLHAAYAAALHEARPGLEIATPRPSVQQFAPRASVRAGIPFTPQEAADLCRRLGLPLAEDAPDI